MWGWVSPFWPSKFDCCRSVHIVSAQKAHADNVVSNVAEHTPEANSLIHSHQVDLGSLRDVISLSEKLGNTLLRIDLLYLIAGIGVSPFGLTQDGMGNHFAINHLAHMVIVDNLLGKMMETAGAKQSGDEYEKFSTRIISESSELHRAAPGDTKCESEEEMSTERDGMRLYARSKLFKWVTSLSSAISRGHTLTNHSILFIRQLARYHLPPLSSPTPIIALAIHPGTVATEQQKGSAESYGILGKALEGVAKLGFMSKEQGSESALWGGTGKAVVERREEVQGRYFSEADGKVRTLVGVREGSWWSQVNTETSQAMDDELAGKLWNLSVKILKEKIGYEVKKL
jgi:WW domain-containing oxidoreductase